MDNVNNATTIDIDDVSDTLRLSSVQTVQSFPSQTSDNKGLRQLHRQVGKRPTVSSNLIKRFTDAELKPWRYSFLNLLREIGAHHSHLPAIGRAQRPQEEVFKLGQKASLIFAPREIASVTLRKNIPEIRLFGLGMLGPNGPLPIHFTEFVRERVEAVRDNTVANFLDMFHHRSMTHLYRAWAQSQSAIGLDRPKEETFTPYISRLAGDEPNEVQEHTGLAPHARWATSAHRIRQSRNPEGLVSSLGRYFGVKVSMQEYQLQWMPIEAEDICYLGHPGQARMLGSGALVGEVVPDRQTKFRLKIGPLKLKDYLRFTPQSVTSQTSIKTSKNDVEQTESAHQKSTSSALFALVGMVRSFIGFEYEWEVELLVQPQSAEPAVLGGTAQLGWSSWVGGNEELRADDAGITGMIFTPENYMVRF